MMAIILAGGKGTRLKPFTMSIPKPLLPLGDLPIIEVVLRQMARAKVRRVVMTLGHMSSIFRATIGDGSRYGLEVEYCMEENPLGTAAPLRLVRDLEDDFLVMNGDILTDLNYQELFDTHLRQGACGTIAAHRRFVNIDYGVIETDGEGVLSDYIEKPTIPYLVSMGINILSKRSLAYIPESGKFDMPDLMLAMRQAGEKVACYETDCYWQDIGRFDDYQQASEDFVNNAQMFLPE